MSICQYCSEGGLCHFSCVFLFLFGAKSICVVVQWIESGSMSGLKLLFFCWWWWTRSDLGIYFLRFVTQRWGWTAGEERVVHNSFGKSTRLNWICRRSSFLFNLFLCISCLFLLNVYGELISSLLSCITWKY